MLWCYSPNNGKAEKSHKREYRTILNDGNNGISKQQLTLSNVMVEKKIKKSQTNWLKKKRINELGERRKKMHWSIHKQHTHHPETHIFMNENTYNPSRFWNYFGNKIKIHFFYLNFITKDVSDHSGHPVDRFSMASTTLLLLFIVIEFTFVYIKSADIHPLTLS